MSGTRLQTTLWLFWAVVAIAGVAFGAWAGPAGRSTPGRGLSSKPQRARAEIPGTQPAVHGPTLPGTAVYPGQEIPLRFNHGQHLAQGMDCTQCHTAINGSTRASDLNFPTGRTCDGCHGKQHPKARGEAARCSMCHTRTKGARVTAGLRAPTPLLKFNHKMHLRRGATCEQCHGDMNKVRLATTLQLPKEADCLGCHDGFTATQRCASCHPAGAKGTLITRRRDDRVSVPLLPRGTSSWGAAHDLAFVEDHKGVAKSNPRLCESCHDNTFCTDCHAGTMRPMRIHAPDYMTLHAVDARGKVADCQSCHRVQSFCLGCHERLGFTDRAGPGFGVGGPLQVHPSGWAGPPGMPQGHAHAAQRNMAACASCHTEDSCLACHATTAARLPGLGVSPHGAGFGQSARCHALQSRNRRVCLKCHAPGDVHLQCL